MLLFQSVLLCLCIVQCGALCCAGVVWCGVVYINKNCMTITDNDSQAACWDPEHNHQSARMPWTQPASVSAVHQPCRTVRASAAVLAGYHVGNIEQVVPYCQGGGIIKNCRADRATKISIDMMVAVAILYFAVTCTILMSKLRQYKKLPYAEIQVAVVFYRLQVHHTSCL